MTLDTYVAPDRPALLSPGPMSVDPDCPSLSRGPPGSPYPEVHTDRVSGQAYQMLARADDSASLRPDLGDGACVGGRSWTGLVSVGREALRGLCSRRGAEACEAVSQHKHQYPTEVRTHDWAVPHRRHGRSIVLLLLQLRRYRMVLLLHLRQALRHILLHTTRCTMMVILMLAGEVRSLNMSRRQQG